ncbi:hypothetical protein [Nocardia crassostreae]|uniref:hypothetical protein n=1 Tax=Nocardia crassostreae TaxID=53428 RepID=UPI000AAECA9D|nr:hypothetical protein [Nocardia crassostreae]
MADSDDQAWYYDLSEHKAVQGKQGWVNDRMGPYPDKATAERALEIARARNKAADNEED